MTINKTNAPLFDESNGQVDLSRLNMFKIFHMPDEERAFIGQIDTSGQLSGGHVQTHEICSVLSNFYLAKQVERSTNLLINSNQKLAKSTDHQAKALNILTFFLVILTIALLYFTVKMAH